MEAILYKNISKVELERLYLEERLSSYTIADRLGCSARWLEQRVTQLEAELALLKAQEPLGNTVLGGYYGYR
jgi:hypothetical protein